MRSPFSAKITEQLFATSPPFDTGCRQHLVTITDLDATNFINFQDVIGADEEVYDGIVEWQAGRLCHEDGEHFWVRSYNLIAPAAMRDPDSTLYFLIQAGIKTSEFCYIAGYEELGVVCLRETGQLLCPYLFDGLKEEDGILMIYGEIIEDLMDFVRHAERRWQREIAAVARVSDAIDASVKRSRRYPH
jgi:hypothetical protein